MKRNTLQTTMGIIFCSVFLALGQMAQAHQCTPSSVAGDYGYTSTGTIVTPAVGPYLGVGRVTVTSAGTFSGTQTTSIAGNISPDETIQGTYTVNPDCTGNLTAYIYHGSTLVRSSRLNVVWDNQAREFRMIFLTAGTAITVTGRRMFRDDDDD